MDERRHGTSRRDFLKAVGLGAVGTAAVGGLGSAIGLGLPSPAAATDSPLSMVGTDGYITVPGREGNPIYIMGFRKVPTGDSMAQLMADFKGHAQHTAPILDFVQDQDIRITLSNLGLVQRPDLTDTHTIHWHGFDVPSPLNDGVPEVSVAVPISKSVTYFYLPHRAGTYMYHCHTEDVEHVQMGLSSIVFVRPAQDGHSLGAYTRFAYNDGDGSTGYDRHWAILLNEIEERQHDADRDIQEFIMTDYNPQYFTMNGRCYPHTTWQNDDVHGSSGLTTLNPNYGTHDVSQPNSALIQIREGERGLLRLANLGYTINAMELPGIRLHVIGQDASLLRAGTVDTSYWTNTIYMGPGEARDVLFDAPAYNASNPSGTDSVGSYNVYYFRNRDWRKLSNHGASGPGGMMTEVRVYGGTTLPLQNGEVGRTYV